MKPQPGTSSTNNLDRRSRYLGKLFNNILKGDWKVVRSENAQDFLESILSQQDKTTCLERLASSKDGQTALHKSLTFINTPVFMNTVVSDLLSFLDDPQLRRLCDGELLTQVLWIIVEPPLFWNNLVENFRKGALDSKAVEGFMWLLLQLILLPPSQSKDFRATAQSLLQEDTTPSSTSDKTVRLMQQIKTLLASPSSPGADLVLADGLSPGGRHDNDFVNFRDIAILPTRAELLCEERSFYLHASSITEADTTNRVLMHLDNQFRLLREDFVSEMQEEFRNVGKKKGRRRNLLFENLSLEGFNRAAMSKQRPCTLIFRCDRDIVSDNLKIKGNNNAVNRKKALMKAPAFLRHQSFGCLVKGNNVLGFASIDRDEDQLALDPPRLCLLVIGTDSWQQVFQALRQGRLDYLQLSTPVFAYEPILRRLQRKTDIELSDNILGISDTAQLSPFRPQTIIDSLKELHAESSDVQSILGLSKPVSLDLSQVQAIIHGLTNQVSLIQGPPGRYLVLSCQHVTRRANFL